MVKKQNKLDYNQAQMFLHCKHCLTKFYKGDLGDEQSPQEAMNYELSSYLIKTGKGVLESIFVAWCKRCKRSVWDSRHLTPKNAEGSVVSRSK